MVIKCKISEVAKDFGIPNKDIIELIQAYSEEPKKHSSVLTEKELEIIYEKVTAGNSVQSFDSYFALASEKEDKAKEEKPRKAVKKTAEKKTAEKKTDEDKKAEKKPAEKKASDKKAEVKKDAKKDGDKKEKKPVSKKPERIDNEISRRAAEKQAAREKKKKENSANSVPQARTKGEVRTIDTRSNDVDLDKYNERYDTLASSNHSHQNETMARKQKIKQKSQQYRKQGMRSHRKETEAEKLKRIEAERAKRPQLVIKVPDEIVVSELAALMKRTATEVVAALFKLGVMATVNQTIDFDTASIVAEELGIKVEKEIVVTIEERIIDDSEDKPEDLEPRSPVVVVMGHVDHGKTSLLDAIRNTSVTSTEAGGITQHIGAYRVTCNGEQITFLDTPGHAAFTAMRARGAMATDIAVLVVAADDGIMPQTIEAINHAKSAGVTIIVAINKMDKEGADPNRVLQQLTEYELLPEEWGGDTICVPVSAKTQEGIDKLLDAILLVAEVSELKANPNRAAKGVVIEARLDKGRGSVATLLVQNGTLNSGDLIVAGTSVGRVRVMTDYKGKKVRSAGPSVPVEITGLTEVPQAGDIFNAVNDEKLARDLVEQRKQQIKDEQFKNFRKVTLDNLFDSLQEGELKELNIVVKADVQGSAEAVKQNLEKLSNDEVKVKVIHSGVGAVSESDVMLAHASNAIIVGFNVRPDPVAAQNAERDGVEMKMYRIIYDCIEEIEAAIKGMLAPKSREVIQGQIEVRNVIKISSVGNVAGCYITDGKVTRNSEIRVVRDGIVIAEDKIASLKRFKDDAKEVVQGFECGITLEKFNDIKIGDVFEAFIIEEYRED